MESLMNEFVRGRLVRECTTNKEGIMIKAQWKSKIRV